MYATFQILLNPLLANSRNLPTRSFFTFALKVPSPHPDINKGYVEHYPHCGRHIFECPPCLLIGTINGRRSVIGKLVLPLANSGNELRALQATSFHVGKTRTIPDSILLQIMIIDVLTWHIC